MKVALVHIRYFYKGGLETRLFAYIDYLLAAGHEVHLFTSKTSEEVVPPEKLHVHLLDVRVIPKPFRNYFFNRKLGKVLQRDEFDFILSLERTTHQFHLLAPNTHRGYIAAKKAWFTLPSDWVQIYLDQKAYNEAKVIYACSDMIREEVIAYYGISPEKVKVLYPPTNLDKFNAHQDKNSLRAALGLKEGVTYCLFVSTSHKRKGLPLLLEVFAKLHPKKYQLLVAGSDFESSLSNVHSLGFRKDLPKYYRAVDMVLHPAIYEPFGQIIVESIACRTPVIVSHKVGAKELITPDVGMVIENFKMDEWKAAIEAMSKLSYFQQEELFDIDALSIENHMQRMLEEAVIPKHE